MPSPTVVHEPGVGIHVSHDHDAESATVLVRAGLLHGHRLARHQFAQRRLGLGSETLALLRGVDAFESHCDRRLVDQHLDRVPVRDADDFTAEFLDDLRWCGECQPGEEQNDGGRCATGGRGLQLDHRSIQHWLRLAQFP